MPTDWVGVRRGIPYGLQWSNPAAIVQEVVEDDQVNGPTGRQSAAAPVRVGSPAESNTAS